MLIRKAKVHKHWKFWLIGWVSIIEGLIIVLSLGYLTSRIRADVLFSEWAEDID